MLAILPILTMLLLFLAGYRPERDWRISYFFSIVILATLIALSTELFSLTNSINFPTFLSFWLLVNFVLAGFYYYKIKVKQQSFPSFSFPKLRIVSSLILGGIIFIVLLVAVVAIIAPPNNWDSMTYHMARVMHWIQNQNLAHYPTYYSAQLVHPPLAEIGILHLQILSGGDRFANLVQWWAMVSSIIGVSLIAKTLGAKPEGQLLASVFCATLPMGILQGSSTQNDYVVALFTICLAYYTLVLVSGDLITLPIVVLAASSWGLAMFTKSSAYFLTFPFLVWLTIWFWNKKKWKSWKYLTIMMAIALLFNLGHYLRNIEVFGSAISAGDYEDENKSAIYSLPSLISTAIRHLSFHSDIVRYFHLDNFVKPITGKVEKLVYFIHEHILNFDASDPRTTMPGYTYRVPAISFNEDVAVNPLHLLLILLAITILVLHIKLRKNTIARYYLLTVISCFLLFSLLLKVQPYSARHHLSFFVLFSPFIGLCYAEVIKPFSLKILTFVLIITCIPWLFNNSFRPLVGENNILKLSRNDIYFIQRQHLKVPYKETAQIINNQDCTNIGLSLGWNPKYTGKIWEYPLWVLISEVKPQTTYRFSHLVSPENLSAKLINQSPYNQVDYCAIIAIRSSKDEPVDEIQVKERVFVKNWSSPPVDIMLPKK